jgi:hypothetical protein
VPRNSNYRIGLACSAACLCEPATPGKFCCAVLPSSLEKLILVPGSMWEIGHVPKSNQPEMEKGNARSSVQPIQCLASSFNTSSNHWDVCLVLMVDKRKSF